jgi:hypothetical protein
MTNGEGSSNKKVNKEIINCSGAKTHASDFYGIAYAIPEGFFMEAMGEVSSEERQRCFSQLAFHRCPKVIRSNGT